MPSVPKLFLSHSAHSEADTGILDELEARLAKEGFQVYCDRNRLKAGDRWRDELYTAIGTCHAAVVLITREALDIARYPWVFKECAMFTLLHWADSGFPIFPVAMTGVTEQDIRDSKLEVLQLDEIQLGYHTDPDGFVATLKQKMCERVCSQSSEPLYRYQSDIAARLPDNERLLRQAIQNADSELDRWDPLEDSGHRLARILLSLPPERLINALRVLLPTLGAQGSAGLIRMLMPFWIDLPAIARLNSVVQADQRALPGDPDLAVPPPPRTAFGVNARVPRTAELHARRAGAYRSAPYMVVLPPDDAGADDEGRITAHVVAEMKRRAGRTSTAAYPYRAVLKRALEWPTFVVLPPGCDDEEVIRNLRARLWPFVFMILTEPDDRNGPGLPNFRMLEPPLDEDAEERLHDDFDRVMTQVNTAIEGA